MKKFNIIFTGPEGAGKSTAIHSICAEPPIKFVPNAVQSKDKGKAESTFAMDYGILNLEGNQKIYLYETPNQNLIDFLWSDLINAEISLILLLDNARDDPNKDLRSFLEVFKKIITNSNFAIGITKMDMNKSPTIADYNTQLQVSDLNPPIFSVDARNQQDVSILVQALLYSLDPGLDG